MFALLAMQHVLIVLDHLLINVLDATMASFSLVPPVTQDVLMDISSATRNVLIALLNARRVTLPPFALHAKPTMFFRIICALTNAPPIIS